MNTAKLGVLLASITVASIPTYSTAADREKQPAKDRQEQSDAAAAAVPADDGQKQSAAAADKAAGGDQAMHSIDREKVEAMIAEWPERPRLGARQMMVKYGPPQEATGERLVWHDQGPFKRILVTREETPHDFPKPHMDYLQHTIAYTVPAGKTDPLLDFDGSVTVDRTAGEMSAKCDLEGHNILTLNIAHDIVSGKMSVKEGRRAFGENVVLDTLGKNPPYVTALQFEPVTTDAAFADKPVIPGSPVRGPKSAEARPASDRGADGAGDAEVLAFVIAVDDNQVLAAAEAVKKQLSPEVMAYAKMLQAAHGKHQGQTMELGQAIKVTPIDTAAVDALRVKGAGQLAELVPLAGKEFEQAYLSAMIKGHTEVLSMIDDQLLKAATNGDLKAHLEETRGHIAEHLKKAKSLQGESKQ